LYAEASSTTLAGTQNLVGSSTCIDSMNSNNDYRAYLFYEATSTGQVLGIRQGAYDVNAASNTYSIPNVAVAGDAQNGASANAPVNLLTSYESYFLQAEAIARGWATGDDSVMYATGIVASFNYYTKQYTDLGLLLAPKGFISVNGDTVQQNIYLTPDYGIYSYFNGDTLYGAPPAYWSVYDRGATLTEKLRHIITSKWFSMCGNQGFEAWVEMRRTGYPDFFVPSKNSLIGSKLPKRFLYPTSESTRNSAFPGLAPLTSKMWWDL
jgi:hypothetical protein